MIPRLAAGLSAIGVLAMGREGIEPHLIPSRLLTLAPEHAAEAPRARASETLMVRLANRLNPMAGCYRSADGRLLMPVTIVNRLLAIRMFEVLGPRACFNGLARGCENLKMAGKLSPSVGRRPRNHSWKKAAIPHWVESSVSPQACA